MWRLRVGTEGTLSAATDGEFEPAKVRYCAPSYICLGTPSGLLPVWPDSLSAPAWRRLLLACRWAGGQDANDGPVTADRRTK